MKEHVDAGTLLCYWSNLKEHPKCPHGPTLLFGRESNGEIHKFYACSACRDRKLCSFYAEYGTEQSKKDKQIQEKEKKKHLPFYHHQKLFILYNQLMGDSPAKRVYCHTCEKLFLISDKEKHKDHEITENISDYQMTHPSELLKPLENSKKEAQYLFSKKAVTDIIDLLVSLNAENVLCIGAPRIHEYITNNLEGRISSLLLDFDGRFHNFFGPLNYCWYNLFNHHFFQENSENIFKEFLTQNRGKNMYLICDPPFGGRVEPISQTIKTIFDLHKKLNGITDNENELKIFFIFPYFMEAVMREKSNPADTNGGLKDLKMTDYKVEYDNHPLFVSRVNNQNQGSQVRLFTNVPFNLIKLPESDGYKYCKRCVKWVAAENKHCKICRSCTSKDGRRYRHCKICQRCVKPTWQHCKTCDRCLLPSHKCGQKPKIGKCFKCNEIGHTEKECNINSPEKSNNVKVKKRKSKVEANESPVKKQKLENYKSSVDSKKNKKSKILGLKDKKSKIKDIDSIFSSHTEKECNINSPEKSNNVKLKKRKSKVEANESPVKKQKLENYKSSVDSKKNKKSKILGIKDKKSKIKDIDDVEDVLPIIRQNKKKIKVPKIKSIKQESSKTTDVNKKVKSIMKMQNKKRKKESNTLTSTENVNVKNYIKKKSIKNQKKKIK